MAATCTAFRRICGVDIDPGKDRNRRGEFQSGYSHPDRGGGSHGLGNGLSHQCPEGAVRDYPEELATGASWLCYYKALQTGEASKVVPVDKLSVVITLVLAFVLLHEPVSVKSLAGCVLITVGTLLMVL